MSEVGRLVSVAVKHAHDAFVDQGTIDAQWRGLNFTAAPDLSRAIDEYDRFLDIIRSTGAEVHLLPADKDTTLDSIYARDASVIGPTGIVLGNMGKAARWTEPAAQWRAWQSSDHGLHIRGRIDAPGLLEGGDVLWLSDRTVAVGQGYRTNAAGLAQLRDHLGESIDVIAVPLPHWHGEGDVMHLMSFISPVDVDLAVVYSRLMPVPFRQLLIERGYRFVEVPDEEFDSMACNVLALAPGRGVMLGGNPRTRAALERAGVEVFEYEGTEISVKGGGGPTCLTRPLVRETIE